MRAFTHVALALFIALDRYKQNKCKPFCGDLHASSYMVNPVDTFLNGIMARVMFNVWKQLCHVGVGKLLAVYMKRLNSGR